MAFWRIPGGLNACPIFFKRGPASSRELITLDNDGNRRVRTTTNSSPKFGSRLPRTRTSDIFLGTERRLSFVSFISSSSRNWNASATVVVAPNGAGTLSIAVQHPVTSQVLGFGSIAALPEEIFDQRRSSTGRTEAHCESDARLLFRPEHAEKVRSCVFAN